MLGSLAAGDYRVEIYGSADVGMLPIETLSFQVADPAEVAIFPPPQRPLAGYSGLWWNPQESGWGLSLHQNALHGMFGAWFLHGSNGQPELHLYGERRDRDQGDPAHAVLRTVPHRV